MSGASEFASSSDTARRQLQVSTEVVKELVDLAERLDDVQLGHTLRVMLGTRDGSGIVFDEHTLCLMLVGGLRHLLRD